MEPFTFTPKLSLEAVSSVLLPSNLFWKAVMGLVVLMLAGGGLVLFSNLKPYWEWAPVIIPMTMLWVFVLLSGLAVLVLLVSWLGRFWIYERVLRATRARGPVTITDAGLEFHRDDRPVHVAWRQVRHHETSGLAILIVTDANDWLFLPVDELVERRVFFDLSCRLSQEAPPEEPSDSL
jgi:hypothetical protein